MWSAVSEETTQKLLAALAEEDRRRAEADQLKRQTLANVAGGIPARLDELAKRTAHAQPDVAKRLGADGIKTLRSELAASAAALAAEVEGAATEVKWPKKQGEFSEVKTRDVHSALFKFMYGKRINAIAEIFKRHGFDIQDDNAQRSQGLVYPQALYDEGEFAPLAGALNALTDAEWAVAKAKKDDDQDIVESLWQD
jgi:hypothetical protein